MSITRNFSITSQRVATNFVADKANKLVGSAVSKLFGLPDPNASRRLGTLTNSPYNAYKLNVQNFLKQDYTQEVENSQGRVRPQGQGPDFRPYPIVQNQDWRIRIAPGTALQSKYFDTAILEPLKKTKGVVFPYTPQIALTHSASYQATPLTHANFQHYSYSNSDIAAITISGDFTAQNEAEGLYVLAVIHFFRSVTKMFFGSDANPVAGTPPPVLFLYGLGEKILNGVPVVVTSFTSTFPQDTDYLLVDSNRIPTAMGLSIIVQPVFNRQQALTYSSTQFINGSLLNRGYI
jgi:hypothetical protein